MNNGQRFRGTMTEAELQTLDDKLAGEVFRRFSRPGAGLEPTIHDLGKPVASMSLETLVYHLAVGLEARREDRAAAQVDRGQIERLACLVEEVGEALQIVGKVLRFGMEANHPDGGLPNRNLLEDELGDVQWAIRLLCKRDLDPANINEAMGKKKQRARGWLRYQEDLT